MTEDIEEKYNLRTAIGMVYVCIIIILAAAVIGVIDYRTKKDKEIAYKDHIINKDIMPYYEENDTVSVQAYVIMDCEGGDGHCYQVELIVYEFDTERARVDIWCCYISDYQCDSDYCATYYLEYLENVQ